MVIPYRNELISIVFCGNLTLHHTFFFFFFFQEMSLYSGAGKFFLATVGKVSDFFLWWYSITDPFKQIICSCPALRKSPFLKPMYCMDLYVSRIAWLASYCMFTKVVFSWRREFDILVWPNDKSLSFVDWHYVCKACPHTFVRISKSSANGGLIIMHPSKRQDIPDAWRNSMNLERSSWSPIVRTAFVRAYCFSC